MPTFLADNPRGQRFSTLLREGGSTNMPFHNALFSPINQNYFNAGTAFLSTAAGIETIPTPPSLNGHFDFEPTTRVSSTPIVSYNVNCQIRNVGDNLSDYGLLQPFPPTALGRLYCYSARGEAALLFPGAPCHKYKINWTPTSDAFWEEIKDHYSQSGGSFENLYLVTEAYTTSRWALDYRHAGACDDASYVVNFVNTGAEELPGNFDLRHTSASLKQSLQPDTWVEYTILESHIPASRTKLSSRVGWASQIFSRFFAQIKTIHLPSKKANSGYLSNPYASTTIANSKVVNKLYLGGTFYLIECCGAYYFESEGHRDDFQLAYFMQLLLYYYQRFGITDWEGALEIIFPLEGNFPVALPAELDFRSPAVGYGGYSEKATYGTGVANWGTYGTSMASY